MRLNRLALMGLGLIVVVLIVAGLLSLRSNTAPNVAQDNTAIDPNLRNASAAAPASSGRGFRARIDIPERTILTRDMFDVSNTDDAGDEYVTDFLKDGYGYITAKQLKKGDDLRHDDLLGSIRDLGVSAAVRDTYRAIAIAVPTKTTLHDIVSIGDYVDVIATFDQAETKVIADRARVLAVDIYAGDYERASGSKRGGFSTGPNPPPAPSPESTPVAGQQPGEPAPTPAPASGQPQPPRPEASITLEVLPAQAANIALAQASNAPLDYLIQPRPNRLTVPQVNDARVTKAQLAPYALAKGRQGAAGTTPTTRVAAGGGGGSGTRRPPMNFPMDLTPPGGPLTPAQPVFTLPPPKPKTYDIVIYPDGLPPRVNTVPIPE